MLTARSAIGAASDYVTTHRGAVGSEARTRLAEAGRRWEEAQALAAGDDPQAALAEARQADALAQRAQDLAERDVRAYGNPNGTGGMPGTGEAPAGSAARCSAASSSAASSAEAAEGAAGPGVRGRGFGGGGGFGGGPGSFGGSGTRGRLGGGGRF